MRCESKQTGFSQRYKEALQGVARKLCLFGNLDFQKSLFQEGGSSSPPLIPSSTPVLHPQAAAAPFCGHPPASYTHPPNRFGAGSDSFDPDFTGGPETAQSRSRGKRGVRELRVEDLYQSLADIIYIAGPQRPPGPPRRPRPRAAEGHGSEDPPLPCRRGRWGVAGFYGGREGGTNFSENPSFQTNTVFWRLLVAPPCSASL